MPDPNGDDPLYDLDKRIKAAKMVSFREHQTDDHHSGAHLAWRMVIELVGGLAIGFGLGYGLDVFFETLPIFMIIFTLLGFVAGVRTMLATAREVQKDHISGLSEKDR